ESDIEALFALQGDVTISVNLDKEELTANGGKEKLRCSFTLNTFDKKLVQAGGWLNYADSNY
ncbi:MAG: 3-isopropylmalate dehydratase small subunit, partial [Desulfobulbaceae bacterium]|nr:3-isopropylmalate dehydratase small subunit [Desulfobulbaceae bacterium]